MSHSRLTPGETNETDRIKNIRSLLIDLAPVSHVALHPDRRPIRFEVSLQEVWKEIPSSVRDIIDEFNLVIDDVRWVDADGGGGLVLTMYAQQEYEYVNTFAIRPHGNSLVVTLPHRGLDIVGVDEGDELDIYVREGEFLVRAVE